VDRIDVAQDRDRWRALVKAVMSLRGNFLTSCKPVSFSRWSKFKLSLSNRSASSRGREHGHPLTCGLVIRVAFNRELSH